MNLKYRKRPVVIEAFQMTRERRNNNVDWPEWLNHAWQMASAERGTLLIPIRRSNSYESAHWKDHLSCMLMTGSFRTPMASCIRSIRTFLKRRMRRLSSRITEIHKGVLMPKILKNPVVKQLNIKFTYDEWRAIYGAAKRAGYTGRTPERDWVKKLILDATKQKGNSNAAF